MSNKEKHSDKKEQLKEEEIEKEELQEEDVPQEKAEPTEADKVQELGEKLAELNDKYLRLDRSMRTTVNVPIRKRLTSLSMAAAR